MVADLQELDAVLLAQVEQAVFIKRTRRLVTARQMRFSFSPHNAAPVTATFEVAGLGELLTPIAKRCGR